MDKSISSSLDTFFARYPSLSYKKGDLLIEADTNPSGVFYITEGVVRQYYLSENGEEVTINLYKPHAFIPMAWAIGNVSNTHFYEALSPVTVHRAPKEAVVAFLKKEPDIMYNLLHRILSGIGGMWKLLESLNAGNSHMKLITSLVILAQRFGKHVEGGILIDLKMSEQDIANYAGMTRETASRELQKLRKDNLLTFERGMLTIRDLAKMQDLLQQF